MPCNHLLDHHGKGIPKATSLFSTDFAWTRIVDSRIASTFIANIFFLILKILIYDVGFSRKFSNSNARNLRFMLLHFSS